MTGAVPINSIDGFQPTDDGKHVLVHVTTGAAQLVLAITPDEMCKLVSGGAKAISDALELAKSEDNFIFQAHFLGFGQDATGNQSLSVRLDNGGELVFRLKPGMLEDIHEITGVRLGKISIETPKTSN
jgi:hypothetical protein